MFAVLRDDCEVFPMALAIAGLTPVFAVFVVINAAGSLVVYHVVPETCGRSLEEVERELLEDSDEHLS